MNAKKRIKIGVDARMCGAKFTGIGRVVSQILQKLPREMRDCHFVFFVNSETFDNFPKIKNAQKIRADEKIYSFAEQFSFLRKLNSARCDFYFFPHFNVPLFFRGKFAVLIHDLTLFKFRGARKTSFFHRAAFRLIFENALKKSRQIFTISEFTKNEIRQKFPKISAAKIEIFRNAIEKVKDFRENPAVLRKFKITKPFFLALGPQRAHKNLLNFCRAAKILQKKIDAQFVITGEKSEILQNFVATENLQKKIIFTDLISNDDLSQIFAAARAFVFPSRAEGFGLPLLESQQFQIPAAASNLKIFHEIAGKSVIFFDPKNPRDIAAKMLKIFTDENLRIKIIARGDKNWRRFSWTKSFRKLAEVLRKSFRCN